MSVQAIKAQLATLQTQISGVLRAYAQAPNSVTAADMPCFVNLAGTAQYERTDGRDYDVVTRQYRMMLYIAPRVSGTPGEAEALAEPFIDSVRQFFSGRPSLGGMVEVLDSHPTGDGGVVVLRHQDTEYIGIEFGLEVIEIDPVTYAESE